MGATYIVVVHITYLLTFPLWVWLYVQSTVVKSYYSNNLLFFIIFHYFHYYHYFYHYHYYSHFCCKNVVHIQLWHCFRQWNVLSNYFIQYYFYCVVSFLWGPQIIWFVILHLECSTQNVLGVCVTWWSLGGIWVIFRSPRVTYYTGYMIGFNVNYSYLYLYKI